MTARLQLVLFVAVATLLLSACRTLPTGVPDEYRSPLSAEAYLAAVNILDTCALPSTPCETGPGSDLETIAIDEQQGTLAIAFNEFFGYRPLRPEGVDFIYETAARAIRKGSYLDVSITTGGFELSELVPNLYRGDSLPRDVARVPERPEIAPIVRPASGESFSGGLSGRHVAMWPSHGWYYEHRLNRWEWQRARLFQTVEDLLPFSYVIPYVAPMLENAGANVFIPRERDVQTNEVVVDNDESIHSWIETDSTTWTTGARPGFAVGTPPYGSEDRPFVSGTYRQADRTTGVIDSLVYLPDIPESGDYAVYISYASLPGSTSDASYTVNYSGGSKHFHVNQQIGGGTWIYLGTFHFLGGQNQALGSVVLTTKADTGTIITADAVRFGGGMGNVERNGQVSGRPRYVEGARYYMQYAGMPDSLVFDVEDGESNDYVDDYRGRGEWVNYMRGNPYGPTKDPARGLGIPIDLSLAFHTDAGVTRRDTTIGTLLIYSTPGMDSTGVFPDGVNRLANRDLSDILQTEITRDIRSLYDSTWTRRSMWDKDYSEAHRPNVPSTLLELLSHQNFEDMKYGLDPRFKFTASRSIYKSILKYLADAYGYKAVVQPLPVSHLQLVLNPDSSVTLSWRAVEDQVEPGAIPTAYRVYTARDSFAFDSGAAVSATSFQTDPLVPGVMYRFRVTAVNDGGESFPSGTVAAGVGSAPSRPVLIVDAFDRISAPLAMQSEGFMGFLSFLDEGVPYYSDPAYTGQQYDFSFNSAWLDDDAPGHGASYSDYETSVIAGNTFDYSSDHGLTLLSLGRSFVTASDEAIAAGLVDLNRYDIIDFLLGEERATLKLGSEESYEFEVFEPGVVERLREFLTDGGDLIVSGAYVATDPFRGDSTENGASTFAKNVLGYTLRTNHAARTGGVHIVGSDGVPRNTIRYNAAFGTDMYKVESPDALEPANENGRTFLRYAENNMSAGVFYEAASYRVATLGFPIETVVDPDDRRELLQTVLSFIDHTE
ncbi:MAG: xanthan lyase [Rhodothermales bacterium]|nr:xanthan lyase [Rhodothermales bacterium]